MDIELCLELLQKPNTDLPPLVVVTAILFAHKLQALGYKDIEVTPFVDEKLLNIECRTPSNTFEVDSNGVNVYRSCLTSNWSDLTDSPFGCKFRHYNWLEFIEILNSKTGNKYLYIDLEINLIQDPIDDIPPLLVVISFLLSYKLETLGYHGIDITPFTDEQIMQLESKKPTETFELGVTGINVFRTNPNPNDPRYRVPGGYSNDPFDYKFREYSWLEVIQRLNSDTPTL